jgi:phospholipid/cholesterol/gamma-HCH transport system substrate-binding protein
MAEPTRGALALRGVALVAAIAVFLGFAYLRTTGRVGGDPQVTADVRNAGGSLRSGSDVKIAGVIVGRVSGISRAADGGVQVAMTMPSDQLARVPANVEARILPATVFGTSFVDLVVYGAPAAQPLAAGAAIPADRTQGTLELQQALDDIDGIVKALGPAQLASALTSIAQALDGRGARLGHIIDTADDYLGRIAPQVGLARTDLRKLADNLQVVDRVAPDLLDATDDGLVTLRTIVRERASLTALIAGGTSLTRVAGDFLRRSTPQLVRFLDNSVVVVDALYDNRDVAIGQAIATNRALGDRLASAFDGHRLLTDAVISPQAPPLYTRADRPSYTRTASPRVGLAALAGGTR